MKRQLFYAFSMLFLSSSFTVFATHNLGGEIEFQQIGPTELEAWIVTYTNEASVPADRDSLTLCWGDGICESTIITNGPDADGDGFPDGELIAPGIKKNVYRKTHVYASLGSYTLSATDPNRNGGILNINFPNSEQIKFHIESQVTLIDDYTHNHSPVLLEPPLGMGLEGLPYFHMPNAFDIDGDSLVYSFTIPLQGVGQEVPNYVWPDVIPVSDPLENIINLDAETGLVSWQSPQKSGRYVIAIRIESYREGALHDVVMRDMMISVDEAEHLNPAISCSEESTEVIEVNIGDTITVEVAATGWDANLGLALTASCGLFEDYYESNASFDATTNGAESSGTFTWIVQEEHARQQPYQLVFKARDEFGNQEEGVAAYKSLRYRVITTVNHVDEVEHRPAIELFPNPAQETLQLVASPMYGMMEYEIVTISGQVVKTGMVKDASQSISLRALPDGLYVLRLRTANNWEAFKFIKQD
jgi:hypothetical protein